MNDLSILREKLRAEMNAYCDDVATGAADDFASYKWQVGRIEGLAIAERLLLDLQEALSVED